jgi:hypothetical protein
MLNKKRKPLGNPLPPVKDRDNTTPTQEQIDRSVALWDSVVPARWRGMLDAKPLEWTGTPKPRFYYDEMRGVMIRASNGQVVTDKEKRAAMEAYQKALK